VASAIRDRHELNELLSAAMSRAYSDLTETQRLTFGRNLLKTYAVELDAPARDDWLEALSRIGFAVAATDDPDLIVATVGNVSLILDRIESRFALCHSLAPARAADRAIDRVASARAFDNVWLSSQALESTAGFGALRGFATRFDRSRFGKDAALEHDSERHLEAEDPRGLEDDGEGRSADGLEADPSLPIESLKLRLWGSQAPDVLGVLRAHPALSPTVTVSSVRVRYSTRHHEDFALDEVLFNGKITARGTSYELHRDLVGRLVTAYSERLSRLEADYRLRFDDAGSLLGQPLVISVGEDIDLDSFIRTVFAGTAPFRLIGVPRAVEDDYMAVLAVDLHGGHRLDFDIAPELIRVYLREGACANTLMRLETNLQQHFDARTRLVGAGGEIA
jgi:hypothetical protein